MINIIIFFLGGGGGAEGIIIITYNFTCTNPMTTTCKPQGKIIVMSLHLPVYPISRNNTWLHTKRLEKCDIW